MKQSKRQILLTTITILFLLAACAPAPVETPDPTEAANQVATSVALTVAAQNQLTAEAQPTATETPLPTPSATEALPDTPTAVPAVNTATAVPLPTSASSGGGGGSTSSQEYSCTVTFRKPNDNTIYKPNAKFDVKWTILNTGTRDIRAGSDLKFSAGTQMITGTNRIELPELDPDEDVDVNFDAVAPSKEGDYVMTYIVEGGLCYPYIVIKVRK